MIESSQNRRIRRQFRSDGRQRYALRRTRTFHYTTYNLSAWFNLATMAETLGIDLWNYTTRDGRGIRKALDFVAPYIDPQKPWPYPETKLQRSKLLLLLWRAAVVYGNPYHEELLEKYYQRVGSNAHDAYIFETCCRSRQHQIALG